VRQFVQAPQSTLPLLLCAVRCCAGACRVCWHRVGREVLDAAHAAVAPGVTTDEIDRVVSGGLYSGEGGAGVAGKGGEHLYGVCCAGVGGGGL
jgi:hypothetical protein